MGLGALAWRARFYEAVPHLHAQGDCVLSPGGRTATLAVYSRSYRRTTLPWPLGGDGVTDEREVLDVFTLDVATQALTRVASRTTDRRAFRSQATPRFEHRDGAVYYAVIGGHGPYGALRRTPEGDVPRRRLLVRVDTQTGETGELSEDAYARAKASGESLRYGRLGRLVWNHEAQQWIDKWGPFRQIGGRHVRSLRDQDSGLTVQDLVLLFVHEDPTQWDKPADPVEICRVDAWPAHRR